MPRSILLIDSAPTLSACRKLGMVTPSAQLVVVTKYGLAACAEAKLPYTLIDDFYPREELVQWALDEYQRLETFVALHDRRLVALVPELARRGLEPFRYSFYDLKILIDVVATKVFQLSALAQTTCDEIVYREDALPGPMDDHLSFSETTNLFAPILAHLRKSGHLSTKLHPIRTDTPTAHSRQYNRFAFRRIRQALSCRLQRGIDLMHPASRSYLTFYAGHDLQYVEPSLRTLGFSPRRLRPLDVAHEPASALFEQAWSSFQSDTPFKEFFTVRNIDYFPLIKGRLYYFFSTVLPRALTAYDQAARMIKGVVPRPEFMLTAVVTSGSVERAGMKAGQDSGLPLISYQEGAGFGSVEHPIHDFAEVVDGDAFLCYGEGNLAYRERLRAAGRPAKPFIVVGSAKQDHLRLKLTARKSNPRISSLMYVGTNVDANRQHHPYNGLTDTIYHRTQRAIFEALEQLPKNINVQIKPHPADKLSCDYFRRRRARPFQLCLQPLEECLSGPDLFIIDFPSTTLLNCCQTDADVFVLAEPGITKLIGEPRTALMKRAFIFDDVESLVYALEQLSTNPFLEKKKNDEYVRLYGIYREDGRSAERAAQAVVNFRLREPLRSQAI